MDVQLIINFAVGAILTVAGWLARQLWDAVSELKNDVHKLEVELPSHYVRRDEFFEAIKEIREICKSIFDKIDNMEQRKLNKN
jgi:uncharacterized coiled-coil DUF342 family protein